MNRVCKHFIDTMVQSKCWDNVSRSVKCYHLVLYCCSEVACLQDHGNLVRSLTRSTLRCVEALYFESSV